MSSSRLDGAGNNEQRPPSEQSTSASANDGSRPRRARRPASKSGAAKAGAKQHAHLRPQRFDSGLMIWQQRNEQPCVLPPSSWVHETHLLRGRAPLSSVGRRGGSEDWASSGRPGLSWHCSRVVTGAAAKRGGGGAHRGGGVRPWPSSTATIWPQWSRAQPGQPELRMKKRSEPSEPSKPSEPVWPAQARDVRSG